MTQQHHQNHATWECKYHVVFIPKYRKKAIFGVIKKRLGDVFHELARRRESKIEESFKTAFSGSPSNHQLSWWFLILGDAFTDIRTQFCRAFL